MSPPRLCSTFLAAALLAGCGRRAEDEVVPIAERPSDVMPLTLRRVERADTIRVDPGRSGASLRPKRSTKPGEVGWESERLSSRAHTALRETVAGQGQFHAEFRAMQPIPDQRQTIGKGANDVVVLAAMGGDAEPRWLNGDEFRSQLALATREFEIGTQIKITEVRVEEKALHTRALVEHLGRSKQARAEWQCRWSRDTGDSLLLREVRVEGYSELRAEGEAPLFREATRGVLGGVEHVDAQVGRGISDWSRGITRFGDLALTGHHGVAVGDVDGDGREDLFVCDGGSLPNRLYRQKADGTVEDISERAGLDWHEDSRAALLIDLDNDGDQDLVVATIAMIAFAQNDGAGHFTLRGGFPGAQYPFSICAADYDLDRDLDIYVCLYGEGDNAGGRGFAARSPIPFDDAQNGGRNVLLENLGDFRFADVTDEVGLDVENSRWSFAAAWEDYDRDGDPDLYVANDFGRNCLYRNGASGGTSGFEEVASELGVGDTAAGMSVAWGDYNGDGSPDLYVGNMFSAAGNRVSRQAGFARQRGEMAISNLRRMAQGNTLFAGAGDGGFAEISDAGGAAMGRWAWSSGFVDVDNDGWQDIVVANGYITGWAGAEDW